MLSFPVLGAAAQKQLVPGHVPAPVAAGKIAPLGRLAGTDELRLAITLPLRNAGELTNLLHAIYDPASPQYHHYLKPAEFAARFGAAPADFAAVERFARTNGFRINRRHPNRLVLDVTAKAADVEKAFHVRLLTYRHPTENRNFYAPDVEPTVDGALAILQVSGLENYSLPHPSSLVLGAKPNSKAMPLDGSGPDGTYMGGDFRQAYVPGTPLTGAGESIGLLQFDTFYPADITNYANVIGLTNLPPVVVVPVDGGVAAPGFGNLETSLDIEMSLSMAPGISNIYVYEAPFPSPWVDILSQMANDDLARQLSSSWFNPDTPQDAACEQIFQQMAMQGQTFFNASGDHDAFTGYIPFPCASPNITTVGGTTLATDMDGNYVSETVWNWGAEYGPYYDGQGSSGGSSPLVPIPPWQSGVNMSANQGSTVMRNVPDVALTADNIYVIYNNGTNDFVGGTSCAAPLWAGFTALMNEQAGQLGQPPVGFLNPAIYALGNGSNYATIFYDITNGNNTKSASPTNYYATAGYDLCTGWGTPAGTNFINALTTPDGLGIIPPSVFSATGLVGGVLTPTSWSLMLTNAGATSLCWAMGNVPAWLSVSAAGGPLDVNEATNVTLQLCGGNNFPAGIQIAGLMVTNLTTLRVQTVEVELNIGQSVVQNGGFEMGDFTDWTLVGDAVIGNNVFNVVGTDGAFYGLPFDSPVDIVHSGGFGAFLGEGGYLATLTQTLPTIPDQLYQLSFWLDNPQSQSPQEFIANWDGTNLIDLLNPPVLEWTNFQFLVTAADTNTDLQFAAENDANYFGFDDVSVTPVPPVGFQSAMLVGGNLNVTWYSLVGLNYEIDVTTNLAPACWQSLGTITAAANVCSFADTNGVNAAGQEFYRLVLLSP